MTSNKFNIKSRVADQYNKWQYLKIVWYTSISQTLITLNKAVCQAKAHLDTN